MTTLPIHVNMGTRELELLAFELTDLVRLVWSTGLDTIPSAMLDYLRSEVLQAIALLPHGYVSPEPTPMKLVQTLPQMQSASKPQQVQWSPPQLQPALRQQPMPCNQPFQPYPMGWSNTPVSPLTVGGFDKPTPVLINAGVITQLVDCLVEYTMTTYKPNVERLLTGDNYPDGLLNSPQLKITVARDLAWLLKSRMPINECLW